MDKVKKLMRAGASLADAVRIALGEKSIAQFALERRLNRSNLTGALNGRRAPTVPEIEALADELGGARDEWRALLFDAVRKRALAV